MSSGRHPQDMLGNEIKKGLLVQVRIGSEVMLAQVLESEAGGLVALSPEHGASTMPGKVILQIIVPVHFDPRQPVPNVWVLQQPKEDLGRPQ
jgi:hypothetical protein